MWSGGRPLALMAGFLGRLGRRHVVYSGALVALLASTPPPPFIGHLPAGLPDLGRWSKASGSAELDDGGGTLTYELYYSPQRSNYEVIRYRLTGWAGGGGPPYSGNERLQWQVAQRDLRRYECQPRAEGGCAWQELEKNTPEYRRETWIIMLVLNVHSRLLHAREDGDR